MFEVAFRAFNALFYESWKGHLGDILIQQLIRSSTYSVFWPHDLGIDFHCKAEYLPISLKPSRFLGFAGNSNDVDFSTVGFQDSLLTILFQLRHVEKSGRDKRTSFYLACPNMVLLNTRIIPTIISSAELSSKSLPDAPVHICLPQLLIIWKRYFKHLNALFLPQSSLIRKKITLGSLSCQILQKVLTMVFMPSC